MRMGILRDFWKTRMGKVQIVSEAAYMIAVASAISQRNPMALTILLVIGAGQVVLFLNYGFWSATRKVKKQ